VIAGAGSNSTARAIELSKDAEALGADAILSVVPWACTRISTLSPNRVDCRSFYTTCRLEAHAALLTKRSSAWPRCRNSSV
jgi:hypothetical protein